MKITAINKNNNTWARKPTHTHNVHTYIATHARNGRVRYEIGRSAQNGEGECAVI